MHRPKYRPPDSRCTFDYPCVFRPGQHGLYPSANPSRERSPRPSALCRSWTRIAALEWAVQASTLNLAQVRTNAGENLRAVVRARCHFRAVHV